LKNETDRRPLRVMQIVPDLGVGGLPQVVLTLCRAIDRERFSLSALCLHYKGEFGEELERLGIPVFVVEQTERTDYLACLKIARILREQQIDVVHTHNTESLIDGGLGVLRAWTPRMVHTEHGRAFPDKRRHMLAEHVLSYATHRFVGVSEATSQDLIHFEKISRRKVVTIPNGIDASAFHADVDIAGKRAELGVPGEGPLIGLTARIVPEKGIEYLVEAMRPLAEEIPTLRLLIAGTGPLEAELKAQAAEAGLEEQIRFLGVRRDIPELLRVLDVFVLCSVREGLPMAILEAMAAECPVVATDVGGIHTVIEHDVNGLLVPPRDPAALASAIARLLRDSALRRRFAERSLEIFRQGYSAERMARRYESLYTLDP
jgi:glycosyltransferase involved in cell wall biosynthesis